MSKCNKLQFNFDKICINDLRHRITIYERSIIAPNFLSEQSTKFTEQFTSIGNFWSAIEVRDGSNLFNDISLDKEDLTHIFYIRYNSSITQENWIVYDGYRYNILKVENMNERNTFNKIYASISGLESKDGSKL